MSLQDLLKFADAAVEETGIDMTQTTAGGERTLLPEGYAFARLVEYIELGMQPQEFAGKAKEPALEFVLGFALWGDGYQHDDGSPYLLRTFRTPLSRNEKSRAVRIFKQLNWKGTARAFPQLLGQPILLKVVHKKTGTGELVHRIDLDGFLPPLDPVSRRPYDIPAAPDSMYKLFLWNKPTLEGWNSIRIEGEHQGKSKNYLQEACLGALDFQGSPLQQLLMQHGAAQHGAAVAAPAAAPAAEQGNAKEAAAGKPKLPKIPKAPSIPTVPEA
jgi:hypothetical protein